MVGGLIGRRIDREEENMGDLEEEWVIWGVSRYV